MNSTKNSHDIVFFLWKEGASGANIAQCLHNVFGDEAMERMTVYGWIEHFFSGRSSTVQKMLPHSGRPQTSTLEDCVNHVKQMVEDKCLRVEDISFATCIKDITKDIMMLSNISS